jgi:hypothetical protein
MLILYIILLFILPTNVCKGIIIIITRTTNIPGQPKRVIKIIIIPIRAKGATKE